ncbi:MAG: hypothetical protein HQL88_04435 [Magnetococcales bacterium]|nr:hypothetical protein [Magnetococcales bacterium]
MIPYPALFSLVALLLVALPTTAPALTLGELQILSSSGQPFRASAELLLEEKESIRTVRMGSASDYALVKIARPAMAAQMSAELKQQGEKTVIWLQGPAPVQEDEPVILLHIASNQQTYLPFFRVQGAQKNSAQTSVTDQPSPPAAGQEAANPPEDMPLPAPKARRPATQQAEKPTPTPQPPAIAPAVDEGGEQRYGPVRYGETLTRIAQGIQRPSSLSLFQAEVAIWQRNPEQFTDNNMNGLKQGGMLQLPTAAEMARIDPQSALQTRNAHLSAWQQASHSPRPEQGASPANKKPEGKTASEASTAGSLQQISTQLRTIHHALEKNQSQFDLLLQRVSALESKQDLYQHFEQRLSTLEKQAGK